MEAVKRRDVAYLDRVPGVNFVLTRTPRRRGPILGGVARGEQRFEVHGANLAVKCATYRGTENVGKIANTAHEGSTKHHANTT